MANRKLPGVDDLKKDDDEADALETGADDPDIEQEGLDLSDDEPEAQATEDDASKSDFTTGTIPQGDLDATRIYLNEIGFSPLLTAEEEVYYARKALKGDEEARKRMIESNLRLVVKIARRYMN